MENTFHRSTLVSVLLLVLVLSVAGFAIADVAVTESGKLKAKHRPESVAAGSSIPSIAAATGGGAGSLIDGSGLEFFINTDVTFTTAESASGSASDATYTTAVTATTSMGGTTVTTLSDAFDGYNGICFANAPGLGECDPDSASFTVYNDNGPASLGCDQCELLFNEQTIGNLRVTRRTFVPDDDEFIRFMTLITNTGASPEAVNLLTANNLGSDSDTDVYATSSGDDMVDASDTWIASFEAFDGGGLSFDPRLGHVIQGPGAPVPVSSISFSDGQNQPFWEYNFTVQPGETVILLNFATGQPNRPDAVAKAMELVGLPPGTLECMTQQEISQVINFNTAQPSVLEIPTSSDVGLVVLTLLLLAAGTLFLLRRRRHA